MKTHTHTKLQSIKCAVILSINHNLYLLICKGLQAYTKVDDHSHSKTYSCRTVDIIVWKNEEKLRQSGEYLALLKLTKTLAQLLLHSTYTDISQMYACLSICTFFTFFSDVSKDAATGMNVRIQLFLILS